MKQSKIHETLRYFQEFHHKCVGWYITVFGIFIAGVLASSVAEDNLREPIGWILIVSTVMVSISFFCCIGHYGARIKILESFLGMREEEIPSDWYYVAKKACISFTGVGSFFFIFLLAALQVTFILVAYLKYLKS